MKGIPVIDVFEMMSQPFPIIRAVRKIRHPEISWFSPLGFPLFRPTQGVSTGPASAGGTAILLNPSIPGRGVPGGSARRDFTGVFVGPPDPGPEPGPPPIP